MPRNRKLLALLAGAALAPGLTLLAQTPPPANPSQESAKSVATKAATAPVSESAMVEKIKEEGSKHSEVMKTLDYLTNVIGPRLTASPNMKRANTWTRDKLYEWGCKDAHLEAWGPFGKGWSLKRFSACVVEPQAIPIIAYPKAWSRGLSGPVVGEVMVFEAKDEAELQKYKGRLKNAILLMMPEAKTLPAHFSPQGQRLSDTELLELADAPEPQARQGGRRGGFGMQRPRSNTPDPTIDFLRKRSQFLLDEGVAMLAEPSGLGDGGTIFVYQAAVPRLPSTPATVQRLTPYAKDAGPSVPQMVVASEHYNRLLRMIRLGEQPKMAIDLAVEFHDDDLMGYNTIAEIPGTDLKDEIVMVGGHMDSWHSGTGATDNAAGVACGMEALRILQALKVQPRRTIRIGLWSGEEQGLYGSRAYVKEHFGGYDDGPAAFAEATYLTLFGGTPPQPKFKTTPDFEKISAYYNLDNGSGKIRGVYMEGNEAVRPIFRKWLDPFRELGATTLSISPTSGTDHQSFDAIGIPAFQFIQDPIEYETRTHHSNMDVYERIQAEDMKQASTIIACFLYNTAQRDEKLPRKPMPAR